MPGTNIAESIEAAPSSTAIAVPDMGALPVIRNWLSEVADDLLGVIFHPIIYIMRSIILEQVI